MGRWLRAGIRTGLAVWLATGAAAAGSENVAAFLTDEGELRDELSVRDGQHGVVGATGTLWRIEPSGAFRVARFVNQKIMPPERQGELSSAEMRTIAETLARQRFETLPAAIGARAPVNARVIRVEFGDAGGSTLTLPPGSPVELDRLAAEAAARGGAEERFLAVVGAVLAVTAAH